MSLLFLEIYVEGLIQFVFLLPGGFFFFPFLFTNHDDTEIHPCSCVYPWLVPLYY